MTNNDQRVAPRRMSRLEQMTESSKREAMSYGLAKIAENVRSLLTEVDRIGNTAARASTILTHIAAEEAGKGFIMVDYMRPYSDMSGEMRSRHLKNVYFHLARGIYVKYYESRPDTFREVQSIVDSYRVSHYLDGPNDVDWIFRNEIENERERVVCRPRFGRRRAKVVFTDRFVETLQQVARFNRVCGDKAINLRPISSHAGGWFI